MDDDDRMEILQRLEKGEISAAEAADLLDALAVDAGDASGDVQLGAEDFTNVTEWSPKDAVKSFKLDNFMGRINVRAGKPTLVVAKLRAQAKDAAEAKKLFEKVDLTFDEKEGRAYVKADVGKSLLDFFRGSHLAVDFDVTLPADVPFATSFGAGPLVTAGVADINANFGSGKVETDAARVALDVGNGGVASRGARDLTVNGGNVRLDVRDAEDLKSLHVRAGNGRVALDMKELPKGADYALSFGNAKVEASFQKKPRDCVIVIDALAGKLQTDIPFNKEGQRMTYADGKPESKVHISAGHSKVVVKVEEAK